LRVDWGIACRYAEVNDNLATIVGAGIDHLYVPALPAPVQVVVAVRLVAALDELGADKTHQVSCVVRAPDLSEVGGLSGGLEIPVPEGAREDWLLGIHIPLAVRFEAPGEGAYTIEIKVGGADPYQLPIHVATVPPPGVPPPGP
jgi:hypothetical protein